MKYNINTILEIIEDRKSEVSKVLDTLDSDEWLSTVSQEHQHLMNFLNHLEEWIIFSNDNPAWHTEDEHGKTFCDKLNYVFVYAFKELVLNMPHEKMTVPKHIKARILLDIGTPGTCSIPEASINLFSLIARADTDDFCPLIPHLIENTPSLNRFEFVQIVSADAKAKFRLVKEGYMEGIFNLVDNKAEAVVLVRQLDMELPKDLEILFDKYCLEQELGSKTVARKSPSKI